MSMIGTRVVRKEDPALLTEGGRYVADVGPTDALHAVFVRSVMAHGVIESIDTSEAQTMPGVAAVYTAVDLELSRAPREPDAQPGHDPDLVGHRPCPLCR